MAENASEIRLRHLLERIQALAEEVRRTALRVHQETEEAHRLAAIVRSELERSRELSRSSRDQRHVHGTIERGVGTAHDSGRPAGNKGGDNED